MHLYTTMFQSTKEDTNDLVGCFGLRFDQPALENETHQESKKREAAGKF
jgi:hypothetical protein